MRALFIVSFFICWSSLICAQLQLETIMKGYDFIGHPPEDIAWSADGRSIYFAQQQNDGQRLEYQYHLSSSRIDTLANKTERVEMHADAKPDFFGLEMNTLYSIHAAKNVKRKHFASSDNKWNLQHVNDANTVYFVKDHELYKFDRKKAQLLQITNFSQEQDATEKNYLEQQEQILFEHISSQQENTRSSPFPIKLDLNDRKLENVQIDPSERYIIFRTAKKTNSKLTQYMQFIHRTGYAHVKKARPKVGTVSPSEEKVFLHAIKEDTTFQLHFSNLTGLDRAPAYYSKYKRDLTLKTPKNLHFNNVSFSPAGNRALFVIRSFDNKDRWLASYDYRNGQLEEIDHQHDTAWIGGPGISSWNASSGNTGWFKDGKKIYFQSEVSGYAHLYTYDLETHKKSAITKGNFEVHDVQLSADEKSFYITSNRTHPGDRNFHRINIRTGKWFPILTGRGAHKVHLGPNEVYLAVLHSKSNEPWELFYAKNEQNTELQRITNSLNPSFSSYPWISPEIVSISTSDSTQSNARVYRPADSLHNGAAVIFVHGAGYLQNAHHYWSNYYREYMFHHLLIERGFTVLDIDYRASAGYGRNHRTAIYRHMGGADLEDQLHGKSWLVEREAIDPDRVGIYGGSYGGFITLMALQKHPGSFACGAALRSVTDWSHYNHGYTSNILNTPELDSLAYQQSSPIYFADQLSDPLLMLHGMEDNNVQYQDVVRLSQRYIELGKTDWNLIGYPVESHGFKTTSSWTDEYRRILNLFETHLTEARK